MSHVWHACMWLAMFGQQAIMQVPEMPSQNSQVWRENVPFYDTNVVLCYYRINTSPCLLISIPCSGFTGTESSLHVCLQLGCSIIWLITCDPTIPRCVLSHTHSWLVHITPGHGRPGFCSTELVKVPISMLCYMHISLSLTHRVFAPQLPSKHTT